MDELDKCKKVLSFLFKEFGTDKSFHEMVDICYELEHTKEKVKEVNELFLNQRKKAKKFEIIIHEQKSLIKIAKIADDYSFVLQKELKVCINEDLMNAYDEESSTILFA